MPAQPCEYITFDEPFIFEIQDEQIELTPSIRYFNSDYGVTAVL